MFIKYFLAFLLFSSSSVFALDTKAKQIVALEALLAELEVQYGMEMYKAENFNVRLDHLREKYSRLIMEAKTLEEDLGWDPPQARDILPPEELRQLLIGLNTELRDGHSNLTRQNFRKTSTLGFSTATLGERLYVTAVNSELLVGPASMDEIKVGDEVVELDGRPVSEWARRNLLYSWGGTFDDRYMMAMSMVLNVPHSISRPRQDGSPAVVKFRRGEKEFIAHLRWINRGDMSFMAQRFPKHLQDPNNPKYQSEDMPAPFGAPAAVRSYFQSGLLKAKITTVNIAALLNQEISKAQEDSKADDGAKKEGDTKLKDLKPVKRLAAYLIHYKGKNIGVIRLPSYSPPGGMEGVKNEYLWLAEVLKRLEALTDTLLIDQLSNSGGSVYYVGRIMSLFANGEQPLKTINLNFKLNQTILSRTKPMVEKDPVDGRAPNFASMTLSERYYQDLMDRYNRGERWSGLHGSFDLLQPYLENEGAGMVFPASTGVFKGRVVILNDNKSASGGDFFPGQMQQNKRAEVWGETSCGLGGPVYRNIESMPGSEMYFRCTYGYAELADGWPLENIGTVPNFYREIKHEDLMDGFSKYATGILDRLVESDPADKATTKENSARKKIKGALEKLGVSSDLVTYQENLKRVIAMYDPSQASNWKDLVIPLPGELSKGDRILSTIWRRLETAQRLREMQTLPAWQGNESALSVMKTLAEFAEQFPSGEIRFADPCELFLNMNK